MHRELPKELKRDLERSEILLLEVHASGSLNNLEVIEERQSDLRNEIIRRQEEDPFIKEEIHRIEQGRPSEFRLGDYESLWFQNRICVPDIPEIEGLILREAHETPYSIHPGGTKMYMDLKELFWWNNMKGDIARYVSEWKTPCPAFL